MLRCDCAKLYDHINSSPDLTGLVLIRIASWARPSCCIQMGGSDPNHIAVRVTRKVRKSWYICNNRGPHCGRCSTKGSALWKRTWNGGSCRLRGISALTLVYDHDRIVEIINSTERQRVHSLLSSAVKPSSVSQQIRISGNVASLVAPGKFQLSIDWWQSVPVYFSTELNVRPTCFWLAKVIFFNYFYHSFGFKITRNSSSIQK